MADDLATRHPVRLVPQPSRVISHLFVPGHALARGRDGRASRVVAHVMEMDEADVDAELASITERFGARHDDLDATFLEHAERLANRLVADTVMDRRRRLLLGATFTSEYAVESAALCNPSAVAAPDQSGVEPGAVRFVLGVRQIGEGHVSSIGFRSGVLDAAGGVTVEAAGGCAAGSVGVAELDATTFRDVATEHGGATEWVLDQLGEHFSSGELLARLHELETQRDTRRDVTDTVRRLVVLAERHYRVDFPPSSRLDERVLAPATAAESNGLEDARFVRFEETDGAVRYHATYAAYDGSAITQQLLSTTDFVSFTSRPLVGRAATDKGMALFPRQIGGRYHALSRHDGATNAVAVSDDLVCWTHSTPLVVDAAPWELVQVGNAGPPIELDEGWLVLTHGVGPMRTYSLGALLLDLDDPSVVRARLRQPLLSPQSDERDGYVPNVVYSCGALRAGDRLLVPYGISDANIGFATCSIAEVLAAMEPVTPRR